MMLEQKAEKDIDIHIIKKMWDKITKYLIILEFYDEKNFFNWSVEAVFSFRFEICFIFYHLFVSFLFPPWLVMRKGLKIRFMNS